MVVPVRAAALAGQAAAGLGPGISERLARARAADISAVRYDLTFAIPADVRSPVLGRAVVQFTLRTPQHVVLDFSQPRQSVRSVRAEGADVPFAAVDDHLIVPSQATRAGENAIDVEFVAGDEPLNRDDEYLYTLFVPARAHRVFPCFDQPDLKARVTLTLEVPAGWQAVANGAATATEPGQGWTRMRFAETEPMPSYVIAFAAGRFSIETARRDGRELRLFHREDAATVARNRETIFDLHASALRWLEEYTGIPYSFGKLDVVAIPSFQFSGMEHPGAILYDAGTLLLEETPTQNRMLDRASLIAHETSHMWFGNFVTMRWFDDVWLKEVFANLMASKIVNPSFPQVNHPLRFLLANHPAAYHVDRTAGANPIRQDLANLDEAGQLYGPIIYQKAPIVMRQFEELLGERPFREGVREYLSRHAFGNATWHDLVAILGRRTASDVATWSHAWIEQRGRPRIETVLSVNGGAIARLTLVTADPLERGLVWPQRLGLVLGYSDRVREIAADVAGTEVRVREAEGLPAPLYVLAGGAGTGYGLFALDDESREYLLTHMERVQDPVTRAAAWIALWENMIERRLTPDALLDALLRALPVEAEEQNLQRLLAYSTLLFWKHLDQTSRNRRAPALEAVLRDGIGAASMRTAKSAWFAAYRDVALTPAAVEWVERVWRRVEQIPGLTLAEADEIAMALELAVRDVRGSEETLTTQHRRIQNPDRKARFAFVMPALSRDPAVREQAFGRLLQTENRRREPWVVESMTYLCHPLRELHARMFIAPSLDLLSDVQRTGDIFLPARWTGAVLGGQRSAEAAAIVRDFLAREPELPQRLRWTVLVAADELLRAADESLDGTPCPPPSR